MSYPWLYLVSMVWDRDTPYSRSVIPLFSCPLSWSVHYNFSGDGSCRIMMEAVVPSWKLSRLLTVAMSKQDFSARKLDCHFFIMVYKSLLTNVFATFCLILNKICGRKSATWPWHTAASPNPIVSYKDKSESTQSSDGCFLAYTQS